MAGAVFRGGESLVKDRLGTTGGCDGTSAVELQQKP